MAELESSEKSLVDTLSRVMQRKVETLLTEYIFAFEK